MRRSQAAGLSVVALTDHDTLAGIAEAKGVGDALGVRLIAGVEFSVTAAWGEMHLLGYFLPAAASELEAFLGEQRRRRAHRAGEIVERLKRLGVRIEMQDVLAQAGTGPIGRPHVARALVARGLSEDLGAAFARFLGRGKPAFVPKDLPGAAEVAALVRRLGGVTSAAHLNEWGTRGVVRGLKDAGIDAVEVWHPAHSPATRARLDRLAREAGLLRTGGSDWHGEDDSRAQRTSLGAVDIPAEWLEALEELHHERSGTREAAWEPTSSR